MTWFARSLTVLCFALTMLMTASPVIASERLALVVGVDDYEHTTPLENAIADARLVANALRDTGFDVIALENPGVDEFYRGLEVLKRKSGLADVGFVYFAGHGVEVEGKNYLLPQDAKLSEAVQLRSQAVALQSILDDLQEARFPAKVVVLDCCRDNPLSRSWMTTRSVRRGLAPLLDTDMPDASLVVYSAGPGQVALDGTEGNSPFTKALAGRLTEPGTNLFQAFLNTSDDVYDATAGIQEPWLKMDAAGRAIRELVLVPEGEEKSDKVATKAIAKGQPDEIKTAAPETDRDVSVGSTTGSDEDTSERLAASGSAMKTTGGDPVEAPGESVAAEAHQVGNTVSQEEETAEIADRAEPAAEEPEAMHLPSRGYFSNSEVFAGGAYGTYNSFARSQILSRVQEELSGAGTPDGKMGPNTQNAIIEYQAKKRLFITGKLDDATLTSLGLSGLPEQHAPTRSTVVSSPSSRTKAPSTTASQSSSSSAKPAVASPPRLAPHPFTPKRKKWGSSSSSSGEKRQPRKLSHAQKKYLRPR